MFHMTGSDIFTKEIACRHNSILVIVLRSEVIVTVLEWILDYSKLTKFRGDSTDIKKKPLGFLHRIESCGLLCVYLHPFHMKG